MRSLFALGIYTLVIFIVVNVEDIQTAECNNPKIFMNDILIFDSLVTVCNTGCMFTNISGAILVANVNTTYDVINIAPGNYSALEDVYSRHLMF